MKLNWMLLVTLLWSLYQDIKDAIGDEFDWSEDVPAIIRAILENWEDIVAIITGGGSKGSMADEIGGIIMAHPGVAPLLKHDGE